MIREASAMTVRQNLGELLNEVQYRNGKILISKAGKPVHQLAEIGRTLAYPKIRRILDWDDRHIEQFIRQLYIRAQIVDLDKVSVEVPADPDDAPILATLVAAQADVLITGDADLLALRGQYAIQTPWEFARNL